MQQISDPDFPAEHPNKATCFACFAFARFCKPIIGYTGTERTCDFAPSRFRLPIVRIEQEPK